MRWRSFGAAAKLGLSFPLLDVLVLVLAAMAVPGLREGVCINMLVADMNQVGLADGADGAIVVVTHSVTP